MGLYAEIRHLSHGKLSSSADPAADPCSDCIRLSIIFPGYISKVANIFSGLANEINRDQQFP